MIPPSWAEPWGYERSMELGNEGVPGSSPSTSGWMGLAGLHLSLMAMDWLKSLCQGGKQPAGELGEQAHHCLPASALPQCFALARVPLA